MLTEAIIKSLQIYGIAIVVSVIVAILIKVLVSVTAGLEKRKAAEEVPTGTVCPVGIGVPEEDVAALSAAIFAAIGPHRILRISESSHGWAIGGRAAQHSSHTPGHSPGRSNR
ncbi:MAG: hypothetical protein H6942_13095 [Candidatus Accumulibacter sp.]|uniref:hypothetical protein n=1 Tax=Accumulibacter sp. TaxID=2053492 RepID=UPI0019DBD5A4|nr:hypothetical protein [Accumulibacter sp.]MBE2260441.1 hypothetical protein [Paracoccaceae bacterium]MCB1940796.1 hypothetical protein [Accumulibacter sp.]MCP5249449.1 hypothetical protein [Accumulibacter sp.]